MPFIIRLNKTVYTKTKGYFYTIIYVTNILILKNELKKKKIIKITFEISDLCMCFNFILSNYNNL